MLPAFTHVPAAFTTGAPFARIDQELQAVQEAVPGASIRGVRLPISGNGTHEWIVQMSSRTQAASTRGGPRWTVYTSPETGQVLGIRGKQKDALQWLIELHHNLLLGSFGRTVDGVLAVSTVLLALSGLWLWWPKSFTWSRLQPRATARPLHYAVGFWVMWPLLAIATTALYFTWRLPIQRLFGIHSVPETKSDVAERADFTRARAGHGQDKRSESTLGEPPVSLFAVLTAAQSAVPDSRLTMLRLPEGHGLFVVMFEDKAEHYRDAPNTLGLRATPQGKVQVTRRILWRDLPARQRFLEWLPRVHQGEFGGVWIRTLWSITGCMPAVLYLSGFLMWRRRLAAERGLQLSQ